MKTLTLLCLIVALCAARRTVAKDMSTLYDDTMLIAWQSIAPPEIERHVQQIILPVLTPEERRVLAGVSLIFPLRGRQRDLLEFSATTSPPAVTLPMVSLRFVHDLCLAFAWLSAHNYSLETMAHYVSMLKYRERAGFPDGRYPQPLAALQIPPQARQEPKTLEVFQKLYTSAILFILTHELGHIYDQQTSNDEEPADYFAVDIMRRIGAPPMGMALFFMILAHWAPSRADFPSAEAHHAHLQTPTHPLTARRLLVLAQRLEQTAGDFIRNEADHNAAAQRVRDIVRDLVKVATLLDDAGMQQRLAIVAIAVDVTSLSPRPPTLLPDASSPPSEEQPRPSLAFHGTYEGKTAEVSGGMFTQVVLQRHGNRITGTFRHGLSMGTINGMVHQNTLYFAWQLGHAYGRGLLYANHAENMLSGTWGHGESTQNGGRWLGKRR